MFDQRRRITFDLTKLLIGGPSGHHRLADLAAPSWAEFSLIHEVLLSVFDSASHAARYVACHGVRSDAVPVALVGECSIPVV
jgi:hypothetical protein